MSGINSQLLKMLLVKKVRTLFSGYYTEIGKEAFFLFDEGELSLPSDASLLASGIS